MATSTLSQPFASAQRVWRRGNARLRVVGLSALLLCAVVMLRARGDSTTARDPEAWLSSWLARRGLEMRPGELLWLGDQRGPFALRPALLLAHRKHEPDDVY